MPQLVGSRDAGYIPADTGPPVSVQTHRNVVMPLLRSQLSGVNEVAELTAGANTPRVDTCGSGSAPPGLNKSRVGPFLELSPGFIGARGEVTHH